MSSRAPQAIVLSFAVLILCGTLLLRIPACSTGSGLTWLQALFTATSAVCVTGLSVIDPGRELSGLGQSVLVLLVQLGGLGILSLSAFVILTLRQSDDLGQRHYVETAHGGLRGVTPRMVLKEVVLATLLVEAVGILVLFLAFGGRSGSFGLDTLWLAVFHSVSAFCNAGFSLFSDNLQRFRDDPLVNLTVMLLIVVGGIGFTVLADLVRFIGLPRSQRRWWRLTLHTRVVLATTALLIVAGAAGFALFEAQNSLGEASWSGRLLAPFFYSITCRTAGFDTVRTASLTAPTLMLGVLLMIVGASPGGTGGGVKTTSAAILAAGAWSRARGRGAVELMRRTIPGEVVGKAVATVAAFLLVLGGGTLALEFTEIGFVAHEVRPAPLLDHLFEAASALGTVGLSTGITPGLSPGGQLILIVLMFAGRTGPLVITASFIGRRRPVARALPEESVIVG